MKLKVCGMRDHANIEEIQKLNPDLMGFIFYPPSPRFVEGILEPSVVKALPASISKVGVFVDALIPDVIDRIVLFGLTHVQLHGNESSEYLCELKSSIPEIQVIKVFRVNTTIDLPPVEEFKAADYFLFDTKTALYGGSGKMFDWQVLRQLTIKKPFFLSGGIDENACETLKTFQHPYLIGIDINSGFERMPGIKNISKVKTFKDRLNAII